MLLPGWRYALVVVFLSWCCESIGSITFPNMLRTNGSQFETRGGKAIRLRGLNWAELNLCSEADMVQMNRWNVNVVRTIAVSHLWYDEIGGKNPFYKIKPVIDWAEKYHVYVLVVLEGIDSKKPWTDSALEKKYADFWVSFASYAKSKQYVLGYEILNEADIGIADTINLVKYRQFMGRMVDCIRAIDPYHMICISGAHWGKIDGLVQELVVDRPNVFYTFHMYTPVEITGNNTTKSYPGYINDGRYCDLSWMRGMFEMPRAFQEKNNVPVFLGEFGCMGYAPGETSYNYCTDVLKCAEECHFSFAYWSYRSYRGFSFHLYYNAVDKKSPPDYIFWQKMFNVIQPYFWKNLFQSSSSTWLNYN